MLASALIPARGGSKGIPGKNLRDFAGKPLIAWAVEVGLDLCGETYVTTDSSEIGAVAVNAGAIVIDRPTYLGHDDTAMIDVVQHALPEMDEACDVVVLLQPTQPLRTAEMVLQACRILDDTGADSVVSVVQIPAHYSPEYAMRIEDGELSLFLHKAQPHTRRQQCAPAYSRDGTVYVVRRKVLEAGSFYGAHCRALVVPSRQSVNLDTEQDWEWAEFVRSKNGKD